MHMHDSIITDNSLHDRALIACHPPSCALPGRRTLAECSMHMKHLGIGDHIRDSEAIHYTLGDHCDSQIPAAHCVPCVTCRPARRSTGSRATRRSARSAPKQQRADASGQLCSCIRHAKENMRAGSLTTCTTQYFTDRQQTSI